MMEKTYDEIIHIVEEKFIRYKKVPKTEDDQTQLIVSFFESIDPLMDTTAVRLMLIREFFHINGIPRESLRALKVCEIDKIAEKTRKKRFSSGLIQLAIDIDYQHIMVFFTKNGTSIDEFAKELAKKLRKNRTGCLYFLRSTKLKKNKELTQGLPNEPSLRERLQEGLHIREVEKIFNEFGEHKYFNDFVKQFQFTGSLGATKDKNRLNMHWFGRLFSIYIRKEEEKERVEAERARRVQEDQETIEEESERDENETSESEDISATEPLNTATDTSMENPQIDLSENDAKELNESKMEDNEVVKKVVVATIEMIHEDKIQKSAPTDEDENSKMKSIAVSCDAKIDEDNKVERKDGTKMEIEEEVKKVEKSDTKIEEKPAMDATKDEDNIEKKSEKKSIAVSCDAKIDEDKIKVEKTEGSMIGVEKEVKKVTANEKPAPKDDGKSNNGWLASCKAIFKNFMAPAKPEEHK